ncbi:hypothetical protein BDZ97DRAFT_1670670 [Flammula alnicola]|nr:hypothetical protein BDZ97DRAFT_1670670 [Flammula alnicola]
MNRTAYSPMSRKLMRMMVQAGCTRDKVGPLLAMMGRAFGTNVKRVISRRTVSRAVLEGYVASKAQIGYEISQTPALTISADGTSNRGVNFEARHIAMR